MAPPRGPVARPAVPPFTGHTPRTGRETSSSRTTPPSPSSQCRNCITEQKKKLEPSSPLIAQSKPGSLVADFCAFCAFCPYGLTYLDLDLDLYLYCEATSGALPVYRV